MPYVVPGFEDWEPPPGYPPRPGAVGEVNLSGRFSNSVLDRPIPFVYGSKTVVGYIAHRHYTASTYTLKLGIVFAFGEQGAISNLQVNGQTTGNVAGLTSSATHVGDGSTTLSTILTGSANWDSSKNSWWQSLAHAALQFDVRLAQTLTFQVTADLTGRKVQPIGGGTAAVSSNPARIAQDTIISDEWRGLATSKIHTASWSAFESWCDEVMGDASKRYALNGEITERDPEKALRSILRHAHAYAYIDDDGKFRVWADMRPPAITGEWSATASTSVTEDSSAGAATTELAVGDVIYLGDGTTRRVVTAIPDDDTITVASAVTVSGVSVRRTAGYITAADWASYPSAAESDAFGMPDTVRVRFPSEDALGMYELEATYGTGTDKIAEVTLGLCTDAGTAKRHALTLLKILNLEVYSWRGTVMPDVGARLEPGDVVFISTDVLSETPARVIPPVKQNADGTFEIRLREYDPNAYDQTTATTDTIPSTDAAWDSGYAPVIREIWTVLSGNIRNLIETAGTLETVVGNTSAPTRIDASTGIDLPNNVPLYGLKVGGTRVGLVKVDSSDRAVVGDGSASIYLNTSGSILVPSGSKIVGAWTSGPDLIGFIGGSNVVVGDSSDPILLQGSAIVITSGNDQINIGNGSIMKGVVYGTGAPDSGDFPTDTWGVYVDQTANKIYFCCNSTDSGFVSAMLN